MANLATLDIKECVELVFEPAVNPRGLHIANDYICTILFFDPLKKYIFTE